MRTYCQGRVHDVPAGHVILLNPGDVHAPHPGVAGGWSFRMFYLNHALIQDLAGDQPPGFAKPFVQHDALSRSLLKTHRMFELDPDRLEAESLLVSGLASINQHLPWTGRSTFRSPGPAKIERVREYLRAYYMKSISIRELSEVAELSPYHLVRSFRAQVGLTPHAFLLQTRIEQSRRLLASGTSITETALHTGFVDQSHFTRLFKRFTGVTPAKYLSPGSGSRYRPAVHPGDVDAVVTDG